MAANDTATYFIVIDNFSIDSGQGGILYFVLCYRELLLNTHSSHKPWTAAMYYDAIYYSVHTPIERNSSWFQQYILPTVRQRRANEVTSLQ